MNFKNIIHWVATILLAFLFGFSGFGKVLSIQMFVDNMNQIGYGYAWRMFIGGTEVLGAIGLFVPAFKNLSALLLLPYCFGAIAIHISYAHDLGHSAPAYMVTLLTLIVLATSKSFAIKLT
jgi:uncharacterized membrane protein YphA (DoxX/SURF4 family)